MYVRERGVLKGKYVCVGRGSAEGEVCAGRGSAEGEVCMCGEGEC